jgi:hypothetical protein
MAGATAPAAAAPPRPRDARLDLFRGLAMLIIFVAHTPYNPWGLWIPAMFGPSDAAEMFVFCSGFASALAFGGSFRQHGFAVGCVRVAHRCWQLYWSQFCLVLAVAAMLYAATQQLGTRDYVGELNLHRLFDESGRALVGLLTLSYVPNYFDILPMYIAVLAMMPVAVLLARVDPRLVAVASAGLWLYAYRWQVGPPAEWWSDRTWFFNPLSWQLLFYTGFAFASGWLRPPPADRRLTWLAVAVVVAFVPVSFWGLTERSELLRAGADAIAYGRDKVHFGPLRYLHFLALAYLGLRFVEAAPRVLDHPLGRLVVKVGQQALPVFLASIVLAQAVGILFDLAGRDALTVALGNLGGFAVLVGVAHLAAYVKGQPWRRRPAPAPPSPAPLPAAGLRRADGFGSTG